jgi:RNA recognition motif-containing protein
LPVKPRLPTGRSALVSIVSEWVIPSMTTLYVGNLPFSATEDEVRGLFQEHGQVDSVKIINDRETGRPRGFGFVDMPSGDAQKAVASLNGFEMNGRPLRVNEARERAPRGTGPGGGGQSW